MAIFESTIHRLRIFQSVVEFGSFSAAARKLKIAQPSISSHIQALEQELGKTLFTRDPGRTATLTEAGKILYSYTLEITSKTQQVELSLQKLQDAKKKVSLTVQPQIANIILPSYLALFSITYPDTDILMYSQTIEMVILHVMEGKSDFGLVLTVHSIEGLYCEVLTYDMLELVVGASHELAKSPSIGPGELQKYPFVGGVKTSNHAKMVDVFLKKLKIDNYTVMLQVEDYKTMCEVVKRGTGVAVMSVFTIQEELKKGELVRIPLEYEPMKIGLRLIYNPNVKLSNEARLFMTFLRREMELHQDGAHYIKTRN